MTWSMLRTFAVTIVGGFALFGTACSGGDTGGIDATLDDFTISLEDTSAEPGKVTFNIQNAAGQTHEFVVFDTDLAEDKLPTDENGDVDETGAGVALVDEAEDIESGSDTSLTLDLQAGTYVVICNLPGHYRQGIARDAHRRLIGARPIRFSDAGRSSRPRAPPGGRARR
jgi:uncharacterized cupredoxin-like copper-binding protein